ncbi:hypothetical protein HYV10_02640 [Candidatus Dependentiae bacterium]|nr:hypothetical protein [Candidatus Dependentiae bacterium]
MFLNQKKTIVLIILIFLGISRGLFPSSLLEKTFFDGQYKISHKIQNYIENSQSLNDRKQLVEKMNSIINSLSLQKRDFFIHVLNLTMNINMPVKNIILYLNEVENMVQANITLPQIEKNLLSKVVNFFTKPKVEEYFIEALSGNIGALNEIKKQAQSLTSLSTDDKKVILDKLEKATLQVLKNVDSAMKPKYDSVAMLESIEQQQKMGELRTLYDSQNYLVLKHCQDILNALKPMLKSEEHLMFTYDRSQNNALINLLDLSKINLAELKTDDELDKEIKKLGIKTPIHRETQKQFPESLRREILENHPYSVNLATETANKLLNHTTPPEVKENVMLNYGLQMTHRPLWQKTTVFSLMDRHLRKNSYLEHKNREYQQKTMTDPIRY